MKTKAVKQAELESLREAFRENPVVVICSFQGIKVEEDFRLRSAIRKTGASYRVVTNRLAKLAAQGSAAEAAMAKLKGMTSVVFAGDDPVGLLKALLDQAKSVKVFAPRAGVIEGKELDEPGLIEVSKMPGKAETQARLLFLLNSGAQRLMGVLNAPGRDLAIVLQQAVDKEKLRA